jgi:hypothetical protein
LTIYPFKLMMMNEEADPDDLQAVFAHEYEDVYDFQVRRHPFTVVGCVADPMSLAFRIH